MKMEILATTFNKTKIKPTIEWFVEIDKNKNLDEHLYNKLKLKLNNDKDFNIVSKDLENLKNNSIKIDEYSF